MTDATAPPASASPAPPSPPLPSNAPPSPVVADPYHYGELRQVGLFTRLLWFCAGADAQLLLRCPQSDRVKFQGLGGVVLTVGVLAFLSGSYAFYTVFSPKDGTALQSHGIHTTSAVLSVFFGLVWAMIIFNIDRFIISSTGKGDGTDKITWNEFVNALPRLAMSVIIGVCLSKPLEIKILESEIESTLEKEQKEYLATLNDQSERLVQSQRQGLREKIDGAQAKIGDNENTLEKRRLEIVQQRRQLELEAEGKSGTGAAGRGPAWQDKKDNLDQLQAELDRDRAQLVKKNETVEAELSEAKARLATLDQKLDVERASNLQVARHLDGLMKRIQISHDIGGFIPFAIMLLLLCIEAGPIFFKLMIIKGAYDYLEENQKRIVRARAGIEPDARIVADGQGKSIHVDLHHGANALLMAEKRRLATEAALSDAVHESYQKKMQQEIERQPEKFVSMSTEGSGLVPGQKGEKSNG